LVATIFKNVFIVNNTSVHRTRNEIPLFSPGYFSDLNVIWNIGNKPIQVERPYSYNQPSHVAGIAEWQEKTGNDLNSVFEDPGLKDPAGFDFEILPGSILHELQIDPGNFRNVGPRPRELWDYGAGRTNRGVTGEGHVE